MTGRVALLGALSMALCAVPGALAEDRPVGRAVVYVHEAVPRDGHHEIGTMVPFRIGGAAGDGWTADAEDVDAVLDAIDLLPVSEQALLAWNRFAPTLMHLDIDGDGAAEPVFLSIEFPGEGVFRRRRPTEAGNEEEVLFFRRGFLLRSVTPRRVTDIEYDDDGFEARSRTHVNAGTMEVPVRGRLVEETRTVDVWIRATPSTEDPHAPRLAKMRANAVTGEVRREVYGLFRQPVETADARFVTRNRFDPRGRLESSEIFENGIETGDVGLDADEVLRNPVPGRLRFRIEPSADPAAVESVEGGSTLAVLDRWDALTGLTTTQVVDPGHWGRRIAESFEAALDGERRITVLTRFEYRDDFHLGLLPVRSTTVSGADGTVVESTEFTGYDAAARVLEGTTTEHTGRVTERRWPATQDAAGWIRSELRTTEVVYDRRGASFQARTVANDTGEEIETTVGRFDEATGRWTVDHRTWFRPGVPMGDETRVLDGRGRLLSVSAAGPGGGILETRPTYDDRGIERSRETSWIEGADGDEVRIVVRVEDRYEWNRGARTARTTPFVDGKPGDSFSTVRDGEGRLVEDAVRDVPALGVSLRTRIRHEGASERVVRSEVLHGDEVRVAREPVGVVEEGEGEFVLEVSVRPRWGSPRTDRYRLGDPMGRPLETRLANGGRIRGVEWFPGTAVARRSEHHDASGRLIGIDVLRPRAGEFDGTTCDLVDRSRVGLLGGRGIVETRALLAGTDVVLFVDDGRRRIFHDLSEPMEWPAYAVDPGKRRGARVVVDAAVREHVLSVFSVAPSGDGEGDGRLQVDEAVVTDPFALSAVRRVYDSGGAILEERATSVPWREVDRPSGGGPPATGALLAAASAALDAGGSRIRHRYDPGWLVSVEEPETRQPAVAFSRDEPSEHRGPVNEDGRRELITGTDWLVAGDAGGEILIRTADRRRELARNPRAPDLDGLWTSWRFQEFHPDGTVLFTSERTFDASGFGVADIAFKRTGGGRAATRATYVIPPPQDAGLRPVEAADLSGGLELEAGDVADASACDFLFVHAAGGVPGGWRLEVADAAGASVRFTAAASRPGERPFWPPDGTVVEWLPDAGRPLHGASVTADWLPRDGTAVLVISVPQLAAAGLDVGMLGRVLLFGEPAGQGGAAVSRVHRLGPGVPLDRDTPAAPVVDVLTVRHSSGIEAITVDRTDAGDREDVLPKTYWNADLRLDGSVVGKVWPRQDAALYPAVTLVDSTDPLGVRPIYCIGADDGAFIEHYRTVRQGDVGIITVPTGFNPPKLEVHRPSVLDDETSPGLLAYGREFAIGAPLVKGGSELRNRMAFSIFNLVGRGLGLGGTDRGLGALRETARRLGATDAAGQAREIEALPLLAEAVLARRETPWSARVAASDGPAAPRLPDGLEVELVSRRLAYPNTYLVPTNPGTAVEPFVDTVREAALIELAACLGNATLARELLGFYWGQSDAGRKPVHASYDARSGASTVLLPRYERESLAPVTAGANVAIARAALVVGERADDEELLAFAANLIETLLREFRLTREDGHGGGITETRMARSGRRLGVKLWPAPPRLEVETNARAYLVLRRALALADRGDLPAFSEPSRRARLGEAAEAQARWLEAVVLPFAERTGLVPTAWFEVDHIASDSSAFAAERWTSAGAWLAWIEAAHAMGLPDGRTREWLDNLARVHGVTVGDAWGIDSTLALTRPDAISVRHTARFLGVARAIGHAAAGDFAAAQLARLQGDGEGWLPAVVTDPAPDRQLSDGLGGWLHPETGGRAWPRSAPALYEVGRAAFGWPDEVRGPAEEPAVGLPLASSSMRTDLSAFVWAVSAFYLSVLAVAILWWILRNARQRRRGRLAGEAVAALVPAAVMAKAEERWAKRVLAATTPEGCPHSRFSNAPVEGNFIIQLKALSKLIMEWRRLEQGWEPDDPRLVESADDEWLNGADEFVVIVAVYMRWVIKAGRKDGFPREDVLQENEDSNHIWSRLLLYFSEYYWGMLTLLENHRRASDRRGRTEVNQQIILLLNAMGMRQRREPFDGRELFDAPNRPGAFDLLVVQDPHATLESVVDAMAERLRIPRRTIVGFIRKYKDFKRREQPYPVHPFLMEAAKLLPHFVIMALLGIVWYNSEIGGLRILPYMEALVYQLTSARSLAWAVPLAIGYAFSIAAHYIDIYRYQASMRPKLESELLVFSSLTSLFTKDYVILPLTREGRRWDPVWYARAGWLLRGAGFGVLAWQLLMLPVATFATFLIIKGLIALVVLVEALAMLAPLSTSWLSRWWTDRAAPGGGGGRLVRFLNDLNVTPTRPTSFVWLSLKYHYQFSVPSGGVVAMLQAVVFYFGFALLFLVTGGYILKEVLGVWFVDVYQHGWNVRLAVGGLVFLNTMYLLRFGLYILISALTAACATYPLRFLCGAVAVGALSWAGFDPDVAGVLAGSGPLAWAAAGGLVVAAAFERPLIERLRRTRPFRLREARRREQRADRMRQYREDPSKTFGVVYMSGDDLAYGKLRPEILVPRWRILEETLGSRGVPLLARFHGIADHASLADRLAELSELEHRHDTTLWHPMQLVAPGESPRLAAGLGLNLPVDSPGERERLLGTWHLRRWLVSMMSTAGNSQDTGINLVDIALRLDREGLSPRIAFYLIQNKYDARPDNRPSQVRYDRGELGQREKLALLLETVAPGSRAFSLNDWTPFGFKAGGLIAMDLVHEESLRLTNMLVLDRNATVNDLDALMVDIESTIADPGIVNVIPGRSTTNTLTPIGQGSQALEEGHRQLLKGVMLLGGRAGEAVGTGWGNIQAIYYGRVQEAMMNLGTSQRPLTTRQLRGCSFGDRFEGMIGFAPHAVGISEDTWAVTQATHNAIALGLEVKFARSRALWHKIRETWSHADWFSAFPRWAGGYFQVMQDPIMQRINDDGPLTVFAKEVRANNGRFFLSVPFAILNILIMPLAIIWGVSPFVQILIVLWNVGFLMNQVLTTLGLVATLEASGFSRSSGAVGAAVAGFALAAAGVSAPWLPGLVVAGFLVGGFAVGLSRWLLDRGRDIVMFGPQLVIHAVGQFVRQSLEFVVSGAAATDAEGVNMAFRAWVGPKEQQPWVRYANLVNLRTLVWGVGLISALLNLVALRELDFLNVVLLLPSLLFSVSCLAGPFLMQPKPGDSVGAGACAPRLLGWATGAVLLVAVATLIGRRGWFEAGGLALLGIAFGVLAARGLRYVAFSRRLRRLTGALERLAARDLPSQEPASFASLVVRKAAEGHDAAEGVLRDAGVTDERGEEMRALVASRLVPLVREPSERSRRHGGGKPARYACEFRRSVVLSLLTLVWFLLVPVPGLLVFSASGHRVSTELAPFVAAVLGLVGAVLVFAAVGRGLEAWSAPRSGTRGLTARAARLYAAFRETAAVRGGLSASETAAVFAAFTDFQIYLDQRAYGYADGMLDRIERSLAAAPATDDPTATTPSEPP